MNFNFIVTLILIVSSPQAFALSSVIDFESVPGSVSSDQLAISSQYQSFFNVSFNLSNGITPYLEAVGMADSGQGFVNDNLGIFDTAAPGYASQLGNFYLRIGTNTLASVPVPSLIINYTTPVNAASAEIWDIDAQGAGTEQWLVEAFDASNTLVDSAYSPLGTNNGPSSLDGKPWTWSFSHSKNDIYQIKVSFTGSKTSGIGLAFDNFSPASAAEPIPEPSTLAFFLLGLGLMRLSIRNRS